ncbi:MAG: DUF4388 domain-containing protein [Methylacidiphilales bacterium]|nr:DUF4388 domain-containing protein [Candidatus Methylacidiphilales bacterium]
MLVTSGSLSGTNLAEILRCLVNSKQTGYLKITEGEEEGCVAVENGVILNARTGTYTGLHALFQFVGWRDARIEFREAAVEADAMRDLAVYDPDVLITGVAHKEYELTVAKAQAA